MSLELAIQSESGWATRLGAESRGDTYLQTVLDGDSATYNASIAVLAPEIETWTITDFSSSGGVPGFNVSVSDKTILITGKASQLFTNQTADFLLKDLKTIVTKPLFDETVDFATIVKWTPPSPTRKEYSYSFAITYETLFEGTPSYNTVNLSLQQGVMWDYYVGSAGFRQVLSKGII